MRTRLNCTVIFVAMEPSQKPATSCAANTRSGLVLQRRRAEMVGWWHSRLKPAARAA